jgi:hypothetical protein
MVYRSLKEKEIKAQNILGGLQLDSVHSPLQWENRTESERTSFRVLLEILQI